MEGGEDSAFFEFNAIAPVEVAGFEFTAGRVEEDDGTRHIGGCDFVGDFPGFGDVVEDDFEPELFLKPENGEDVVVTVGVMVDGAFSVENVGERFEGEIALDGFVGISFGALLLVGLGIEEFLADEGADFPRVPGKGPDSRIELVPLPS